MLLVYARIPLDVVLLCEVVVANFYPEDWAELKNLPGWNDPIVASQKLCIIPFLNELQRKVGVSSRSLLDHMWAQSVGPVYVAKPLSAFAGSSRN